MTVENPRIYIACLASYNSGYHHGVWIDATQNVENIYKIIKSMLEKSPVPFSCDWEIHDHIGFYGFRIHDLDIENIPEIANFILEHGSLGAKYLDLFGREKIKEFDERYLGSGDDEADFAEQYYFEISSETLDSLKKIGIYPSYIDWETVYKDNESSDWHSIKAENRVHVFSVI